MPDSSRNQREPEVATSTTHADLIVVGAGLAGAATAWAASRQGRHVVVLEAGQQGHRTGSSHGSARIFRRAYPDPLYVELTGAAAVLWRELEAESGETLLTLTGCVDFGALRDPVGLHEILTGCGVEAELLAPEAAAERWPQFSFAGAGPVLYHPGAGVIDPERAMAAMLRQATAHGADVRFGTPVTRLERTAGTASGASGAGAAVHTDSGTFTAPVAVIAAGAWVAPLTAGLVELPPLRVTQQQIFHFAPRAAPPATPWPALYVLDEVDSCYGLPGGRDGEVPGAFKVGEHHTGSDTTAATRDFQVDPAARARTVDFVRRRIPALDLAPVNEATCLYTWTANEDFILDRPGSGPFVIASACSGHGAKFAPLLGEILAGMADGRPTPNPRFTLAAHLA